MDTIQVTGRVTIHEGKSEEFRNLGAQCMESVRMRDSGTLQYDWFFNDSQTECVSHETYKNSEAVLEHMANLGTTLGAILAIGDWTFEIFGAPSAELVQAAAGLRPRIYSHFQSI